MVHSTVYPALDLPVEEGLVLRTDLGTRRAVLEPRHEHPHRHLVCEACGAVAHVHDDVLGDLGQRVEAAAGFRLGRRELVLYGTRGRCAAREGTGAA